MPPLLTGRRFPGKIPETVLETDLPRMRQIICRKEARSAAESGTSFVATGPVVPSMAAQEKQKELTAKGRVFLTPIGVYANRPRLEIFL